MRHRTVISFILSALLAASPAVALDLDAMRLRGGQLAAALETGRGGDWDAAGTEAALTGDALLADIVLWRKLRAGQGSAAELAAFAARRPGWPGQDALREAVLGESGGGDDGGSGTVLTGDAATNWEAFSAAWRADDWITAETLILAASATEAGLGDPERWGERRRSLVRRAQREGRYQQAYAMAASHFLTTGRSYADCEWLAGWIALRYLNDPSRAVGHFLRFQADVATPISLGRGAYWLGRAYEAMGDTTTAAAWYTEGARHQTAFYGQLAAAKLSLPGDTAIASAGLPDWRTAPVLESDDVQAALLVYYAGETELANQFFVHLAKTLPGEAAVGAVANLALHLGEHAYAVRMAKAAARRGMLLHAAYYPVHPLAGFERGVEPAFALSIARQETELDPNAVSPAGARGLMQLMPGTAQKVAGQLGLEYDRARLTSDWQYNATLGQTYLADQILRFGGSYALAAAAYNAGPGRVDQWIEAYGDPRLSSTDLIDWLETIPFEETRNYVQRVMEGLYVYRARLAGQAGAMTILADLGRGRY